MKFSKEQLMALLKRNKPMGKKGILDQLIGFVIGLAVISVVIVVVALILAKVGANATVAADSNATYTVRETQKALMDIPPWLSIIVITFIGMLIIGLIMMFRRNK